MKAFLLFLAASVVAFSIAGAACLVNVWCERHSTYAAFSENEYRSDECYCVYKHTYRDGDGNTQLHVLTTPCE